MREEFLAPDRRVTSHPAAQTPAVRIAFPEAGPVGSGSERAVRCRGRDLQWPTVRTKGSSEPGVLTMGCLATNSKGQTFVVVALPSDPATALSTAAGPGLLAIVQSAFKLVR